MVVEQGKWPEQPKLTSTKDTSQETVPMKQTVHHVRENVPDEWDLLLERNSYWRTLRVTAWALRFVDNSLAKGRGPKKKGPLHTGEIEAAKNCWIRKAQRNVNDEVEAPGWQLIKDDETGILKCKGRIAGYQPTYLDAGQFVEKLIRHTHEKIMHLGVANTMAATREHWWVPHLRCKVKKTIRGCNTCKVYSTKPYGAPTTASLPDFRTSVGRPFEVTGVDFAGPLICKVNKNETQKCYVIIFACVSSRAVHLELTHTGC